MVKRTPRRMKLSSEWPKPLHEPRDAGGNWSLVLPFEETFANSFKTMCADVNHHVHIGKGDRCIVFLNDSHGDEQCVETTKTWINTVGKYVAIRDCLAVSFALDYRMEDGSPQKAKTAVGTLCRKAKPYKVGDAHDTRAAKQLGKMCSDFLAEMTCFDSVDCLVGMAPSSPDKPFDLPRYLAAGIATSLNKEDLSQAVQTVKARKQLKGVSIDDKLKALEGTISVAPQAFQGRDVLIVDDLYQSGTSMNYLAMLLQANGAKRIFGLACEKTSGNFDNL